MARDPYRYKVRNYRWVRRTVVVLLIACVFLAIMMISRTVPSAQDRIDYNVSQLEAMGFTRVQYERKTLQGEEYTVMYGRCRLTLTPSSATPGWSERQSIGSDDISPRRLASLGAQSERLSWLLGCSP